MAQPFQRMPSSTSINCPPFITQAVQLAENASFDTFEAMHHNLDALNATLSNEAVGQGFSPGQQPPLLRSLDAAGYSDRFCEMIRFAQTLDQQCIGWRQCLAHQQRLDQLDLNQPKAMFYRVIKGINAERDGNSVHTMETSLNGLVTGRRKQMSLPPHGAPSNVRLTSLSTPTASDLATAASMPAALGSPFSSPLQRTESSGSLYDIPFKRSSPAISPTPLYYGSLPSSGNSTDSPLRTNWKTPTRPGSKIPHPELIYQRSQEANGSYPQAYYGGQQRLATDQSWQLNPLHSGPGKQTTISKASDSTRQECMPSSSLQQNSSLTHSRASSLKNKDPALVALCSAIQHPMNILPHNSIQSTSVRKKEDLVSCASTTDSHKGFRPSYTTHSGLHGKPVSSIEPSKLCSQDPQGQVLYAVDGFNDVRNVQRQPLLLMQQNGHQYPAQDLAATHKNDQRTQRQKILPLQSNERLPQTQSSAFQQSSQWHRHTQATPPRQHPPRGLHAQTDHSDYSSDPGAYGVSAQLCGQPREAFTPKTSRWNTPEVAPQQFTQPKNLEVATYEIELQQWRRAQAEAKEKVDAKAKCEEQLMDELKSEIRNGVDVLAFRYHEYLEVFPITGAGELMGKYHRNLLANQHIEKGDHSENAEAVRFAKRNWWNYWEMKDKVVVVEIVRNKTEGLQDELKRGGHLVTEQDLDLMRKPGRIF